MYGIVNKAIQELVEMKFGSETWQKVHARSQIKEEYFLSNEAYDDGITYQLAGAVSEETGLPLKDVLMAFGEFWVLHTGNEKYGSLMKAGGDNLKEFLINLPNFHSRVMLFYPNLTPPEFRVSNVLDSSLDLHYFSTRAGLKDFVTGLIHGLGKLYSTAVEVTVLQSRDEGADHEIFHISW